MSLSLTNQKASQALRGQNVIVTLASGELSNLASLEPGQECSISGVAVYGTVSSVDSYGTSFEVTPIAPNKSFESAPGYLESSQTIVVTT